MVACIGLNKQFLFFDEQKGPMVACFGSVSSFKFCFIVYFQVSNATCSYINEPRFLLNMTGVKRYDWHPMTAGYGWIDTLQCMAVR